jgi:hypothetical protein
MTLFPGDEIVVVLNEGVKVTGNVLLTSEILIKEKIWVLLTR